MDSAKTLTLSVDCKDSCINRGQMPSVLFLVFRVKLRCSSGVNKPGPLEPNMARLSVFICLSQERFLHF